MVNQKVYIHLFVGGGKRCYVSGLCNKGKCQLPAQVLKDIVNENDDDMLDELPME